MVLLVGSLLLFACGKSSKNGTGVQGGAGGAAASSGAAGALASGGSSGAISSDPIPIEDLCPVFTSDLCTYLMQCNGAKYRDMDHCRGELDCFGMNELLASAASGAVLYDPSKVGECHARFLASPCTFGFFLFTPDIYEVLAYCPGTLTPEQGDGASCVSNGECTPGLYCYKGTDWLCPGTCRKFSVQGETCAGSARCADGLACAADGTCQPEQKAGDPCDGFCSYSVTCVGDAPCTGNIWCDRSVNQCKAGLLEGETCGPMGSSTAQYTADCAINLWCDGVGGATGVCRVQSAEGGPCNDAGCQDGLHCVGSEPNGTTAKLGTCSGPSAAGGECVGDRDCQTGLVCVSALCAAPGVTGAACFESADCATGFVCGADDSCVAALYPGSTCDPAGQPCTFSRCLDGTCVDHAKVGEACAIDDDCATGYCIDQKCYDASVCNAP